MSFDGFGTAEAEYPNFEVLEPVHDLILEQLYHLAPLKYLLLCHKIYRQAIPILYHRIVFRNELDRCPGIWEKVSSRQMEAYSHVKDVSCFSLAAFAYAQGCSKPQTIPVFPNVKRVEFHWILNKRNIPPPALDTISQVIAKVFKKPLKEVVFCLESPGNSSKEIRKKSSERLYQMSVLLTSLKPEIATFTIKSSNAESYAEMSFGYIEDLQYSWSNGKVLRMVLKPSPPQESSVSISQTLSLLPIEKASNRLTSLIQRSDSPKTPSKHHSTPSSPVTMATSSLLVRTIVAHIEEVHRHYIYAVCGAQKDYNRIVFRGQTGINYGVRIVDFEYHLEHAKEIEESVMAVLTRKNDELVVEFVKSRCQFVDLAGDYLNM
ncbi:uncharacterized protein L203_106316 [Cryptococcus depauperatus CBS 7841]|uniref:Uncharacterized protein n=1 Tax=Cryptococcus depauperatus CBS 7841 TaxID=1295531 RepID=A0A1E3IJA9_9TREE|nr:hypothetical protein L203_02685 [Cryptococcus depauperatus CBS 7841]